MDCSTSVLPALGGETIRPRWPLPIGATRSMIRVVRFFCSVSSRSRACGYNGVSLPNSGRAMACSGVCPLTLSSRTRALNFCRLLPVPTCCSPSLVALMAPETASPLRMPFLRTMPIGT